MRITLDVAADVLQAARERAQRENKTVGEVVSELLRMALTAPTPGVVREPRPVYGLKPFARRGAIVTNALIDQLRHEGAY